MSVRHYANAPATTLSSSVTALATNIDVASITGLPINYPFILILDRGTASEEVVLVTGGTGTSLTVERGYDGTTAFSHNSAAAVEHGISAIDPREANEHINASSAVHGVTGDVVGTTDTQVVTNKDLTDGTNTFPSTLALDADLASHEADTSAHGVTGAVVGTTDTQTLTNKDLSDPSNVLPSTLATDADLTAHESDTTTHGATGAVVGTTNTQTLTNKTLTSPTITDPAITGVGEVKAARKSADTNGAILDSNPDPDPHLTFDLTPGTWLFDLVLFVESDDDAADFKCNFSFDGTSTSFVAGEQGIATGSTSVTSTSGRESVVTALGSNLVSGAVGFSTFAMRVMGSIVVTATGTFTLNWSMNSAMSATITLNKGSWMRAERIA